MRAIIVDDSRAIRSIVGKIVREVGFETVEAANGQEAMNQLGTEGGFELALVDWNMPVMNGLAFVQAARADHRFDGMRIVMVTTQSEIVNVQQALEAGASEYLMKPFNKDALLEKLAILDLSGNPG